MGIPSAPWHAWQDPKGNSKPMLLGRDEESKDQPVLELYCVQTLGTTKWRGDRLIEQQYTIY